VCPQNFHLLRQHHFTNEYISIDFFFKNYKNQQLFFSREKFSFSNVHLGLYEAQKIFLSREKIFSLPIFKIFPPYQFFFSPYFSKKVPTLFFQKHENQQLFFFQLLFLTYREI
jgi:hypothetical protein